MARGEGEAADADATIPAADTDSRAAALASLACVDFVKLFAFFNPGSLLLDLNDVKSPEADVMAVADAEAAAAAATADEPESNEPVDEDEDEDDGVKKMGRSEPPLKNKAT